MKFPTIKMRTLVFWSLLLFYSFFIANHFFVSYKEGATDMKSASPGTDASNNTIPVTDASNSMVVAQDLSGEVLSLKKKEEKMKHDLDELRKQIHKLEMPSSA